MLYLSKIFVTVNSDLCSSFRSKYINPTEGTERLTNYDSKIVFLEDKQEIFTKGKIYGLNNDADVSALENLIGTMPKKIDNSEYGSIVEYINSIATGQAEASTKLSSSIQVAGGPLANNVNENGDVWPWTTVDGVKTIPAGTSFEEILTKLLLKTITATLSNPVYTWNPSLNAPSADIKSGTTSKVNAKLPIGTQLTVTYSATNTVSNNTATASIGITNTGGNAGYYLNDNTIFKSGNYSQTVTGTQTGTATASATWNGTDVDNNATVTVTNNGDNTLSVSNGTITVSVDEFDTDIVYASNNVKGKEDSVYKTISATGITTRTLDRNSSNSKKVTGYYPIYYGNLTNTGLSINDWTTELMTSKSYKDTVITSITAKPGEGTFFIALPEGHANYSKTKFSVINSTTKASLGGGQVSGEIEYTYPNTTITKKYKVFFISNSAGWVGTTEFNSISFS